MTYMIEKKIENLQKQLAEEQAKLKAHRLLSDTEKLAIDLHNQFCHHNHTDGCSWLYHMKDDIPTWTDGVQQRYLNMAAHIIDWGNKHNISETEVRKLIGMLRP